MTAQHRAPLVAFVLVAMVAGGVAAQSLHEERQRASDDTVAAGTANPRTSSPTSRDVAEPTPTDAPASTGTPAPGTSGSSTSAGAPRPPGDVPPGLPVGVVGAIPGLAAFLAAGSSDGTPPSFQEEQPSPGVDLGSTSSPSPTPEPTPSAPPTSPSGEPSPTGTPTGSPSTSASTSASASASPDAERPVSGSPTPTPGSPTPTP